MYEYGWSIIADHDWSFPITVALGVISLRKALLPQCVRKVLPYNNSKLAVFKLKWNVILRSRRENIITKERILNRIILLTMWTGISVHIPSTRYVKFICTVLIFRCYDAHVIWRSSLRGIHCKMTGHQSLTRITF